MEKVKYYSVRLGIILTGMVMGYVFFAFTWIVA